MSETASSASSTSNSSAAVAKANAASAVYSTQAVERLRANFPGEFEEPSEFRGEISLLVPRERVVAACSWLKQHAGFDMLTDLSGIDHYGEEPRFEVVYLLCALDHGAHLRVKTKLPELDLRVDTVSGVWNTANWHEREAFDMFGIQFTGHPNLKRILMWPGYPHFPLRKEFPVAGLPASLPLTAEPEAGSVVAAPMAGGPFIAGTGASVRSMGSSSGLPATSQREPRQHETVADQIEDARLLTPKGKDAP
jgi:NADH-quinone oxidoreductase subunit C